MSETISDNAMIRAAYLLCEEERMEALQQRDALRDALASLVDRIDEVEAIAVGSGQSIKAWLDSEMRHARRVLEEMK